MGAAIPHLAQLAIALPPILPFPSDEIHTEIITGTTEVHDEIQPNEDEEEDKDVVYSTRHKSTLTVIIHLGPEDVSQQTMAIDLPTLD